MELLHVVRGLQRGDSGVLTSQGEEMATVGETLTLPLIITPFRSRSAEICPRMTLASVRCTLMIWISSAVMFDDSKMKS